MTATKKPRRLDFRGRALALVAFVVLGTAGVAACGSDPYAIKWKESPDTAVLYSLARPQLNLVGGFDFYNRISVRVEDPQATGNWDVAVDTRDGKIVLVAPGVLGVDSKARVTRIPGVKFEDVVQAPGDTTLYTATSPVPVEFGSVYVMRTRQQYGPYGQVCVFYAKLAPLEIDPVEGLLRFVYDASPVCNDRWLIPRD